jgi:hypothetical protein
MAVIAGVSRIGTVGFDSQEEAFPASEGEGSRALHKNLDLGRPNNLETGVRNSVVRSRVGHTGDRGIAESFESGKVRNPYIRKTPCLPK